MRLGDELAIVDVETVGLNLEHDIWEIAVAIGDGPVECYQVPHSLQNADPTALEINGYWDRFDINNVWRGADVHLRKLLTGKTIVGANPAFDTSRLQRRWGAQVWHYRTIDVESMAYTVLDLQKVPGLATVLTTLGGMGYTLPVADHSALHDVVATREVFRILRQIGRERVSETTRAADAD